MYNVMLYEVSFRVGFIKKMWTDGVHLFYLLP